jgi:predicted CXXCH cytochrome family protein
LLAGAALWLFLAAIPALADGGPHVAAINDGTAGITADSCAGCHRAHTAQGVGLLVDGDEEALCLTCHGTDGKGASTNVEDGVQYSSLNNGTYGGNTGPVLGALRSGGFVNARIASGSAYRLAYTSGTAVRQNTKVPVTSVGWPVGGAHLKLPGAAGVSLTGVAWGNGAISATANPGTSPVAVECATCHNPHGNNKYRILNPVPNAANLAAPAAPAANVTDGVLPAGNAARNYTVIQVNSAGTTRLQTAAEVQATGLPNTAGDYFHRRVPWNSTASSGNWDAPNGVVDQTDGISFNSQMNTWCSTCHTRYNAPSGAWETPSGDAIFKYRHPTTSNKPCTTCHVAHGSDAAMNGVYSGAAPYPGGTPVASSNRLLKIDNRGTCQACHDPTETITAGTGVGPVPVPLVP